MTEDIQLADASSEGEAAALALLRTQRSHVLFVLTDAAEGEEVRFLDWYRSTCQQAVAGLEGVLSALHYLQHEVDVTQGRWPRLSLRYLALYELSVDGASAAGHLTDQIATIYRSQPAALPPACWLYYPSGERVGRRPQRSASMLTVAFANSLRGHELEFREWYATCHIRHAMRVPALVSGQCYERARLQRPSALEPSFQTIAVYEQEDTPERMMEQFTRIPKGTLSFPTLDLARFSESVYRLI